jgi:hypothetical protein
MPLAASKNCFGKDKRYHPLTSRSHGATYGLSVPEVNIYITHLLTAQLSA